MPTATAAGSQESACSQGSSYLGEQRLKSQDVNLLLHTFLQSVGDWVLGKETWKLAS